MGIEVVLEDKPYKSGDYPGVTDYDLLSVKMTKAFGGKVKLAANFGVLTGHIGRLEIDTEIGDGLHIGAACHDLVIEEAVIYVHDLPPSVLHWDAIQLLGGYRCTFRRFVVIQRNMGFDTEGRCVFMNAGKTPPDIEDVIFEKSWLESHRDPISTKSQVFTQAGSLRSGIRDSVLVEAQPGAKTLWQKNDAYRS